MNAKDILQSIIDLPNNEAGKFDTHKFIKFFRAKNDKLEYPDEILGYEDIENNFSEGRKLAEGKLDNDELIVCSFLVNKELTERSGKKAQYTLGKKILKEQQADAGIFIFYDSQGNFRFSLIYANYLGKRRDWSNFKRFTYFVSPERTNKTFLKQIGEGDFSSLQTIKEAFSVDPVTKQFYNEIQGWYFWAMDKIKFPDDYKYNTDPARDKEIRNATNLIRLITRIIFIWFLTKKDLVPLDLFSKEKLKKIVKDFMKDKNASNFYNAVLQNLFFGTLNQKMNERNFAGNEGYPANRKEYGIKNLYRYADKFLISKNEVLKLFKDIPFLNGGLFDCLDKENEAGKVIYVDGFSRNPAKQSIIPDYLFFQKNEEMVDLSEYGLGKKLVRGLIEILNSYNFTIDENTPIDQEVALDPELLGKVFENLLASYNPETATSARKSTGSYYTPREIVDYMVEISLFEYLKGKLPETEEEKIKMLLSYSEEIPEFSNEEKQKIISAIDEIKILDPACGSGAFPMGVLHKLVFALEKLDPENKYWYELQYQKALKESEDVFKQGDKNQREERLKEINETFDEGINYPDYARKLYLIENCIYGVDIQPIAIQISKLRFFISLVLDQKVDRGKENFGIKALPNLETRFVAANTLLGLDKPQHLFYTDKIKKLEDDIKSLRHKYFQTKTRSEKLNYQKQDTILRELLAKELKEIGFSSESSEKIVKFDIYDPNASADWFDPEWMFGIKDGFDIVIANPPYIDSEGMLNFGLEGLRKYISANYSLTKGNWDIYVAFFEQGFKLLNATGILTYITPDKWISKPFGDELRKNTVNNIYSILKAGREIFEGSKIDAIVSFFIKNNFEKLKIFDFKDNKIIFKREVNKKVLKSPFAFDFLFSNYLELLIKIETMPNKKLDSFNCENACATSDAYKLEPLIKDLLQNKFDRNDQLKVINTGTISKYVSKWGIKEMTYLGSKYLCPVVNKRKFLKLFNNSYAKKSVQSKIIIKGLNLLDACLDLDGSIIPGKTTLIIANTDTNELKFLSAILNSKLTFFYIKEKYPASSYNKGINFTPNMINNLPVPQTSKTDQKPFIELVDKILSITKDDDYFNNSTKQAQVKEYERQIDQMVYKLYGLTDEEIKIVEG